MTRLEAPGRRNATLHRRALIAAAPAALLAACEPGMPKTASRTPELDLERLQRDIDRIASSARPGVLGVGLLNLESGQAFTFNGDSRFPMQSVFKLPLAVAALSEIEQGRLARTEQVTLEASQLSPGHSPIADAWPDRRAYAIQDLIVATLVESDNTAADVLMKRLGGPGAVTAWLAGRRIDHLRIDRYERDLQPEIYGMASFRPAWRNPAAFQAAREAVPPARRLAAMRRHLADPRDTATPRAMLTFLQAFDRQELVAPALTKETLAMMARTHRAAGRMRAGLPSTAYLAHRPGTSGVDQGLSTAHNDVGFFRLEDGRAYALALFLSGSTQDEAGRDRILADATRAAVRAVG